MNKNPWLIWSKIILVVILIASLAGFWYFETSLILKILAIILAAVGTYTALRGKTEKPPLSSRREFMILLVLYLGLYSLYNLLYGLSIPLYLIMVAVLVLVPGLFFGLLMLDRIESIIDPALFRVFVILLGLVILEIFLSLSFWPLDPKVKSLIIVVIFYLITNLIYLYTHSMLKLKRIAGFLIAAAIIFVILALNIWFGLRGI